MAVTKQMVDGRPAMVADREDGYTVIVFDDGERVILSPDQKNEQIPPPAQPSNAG